MNPPGRNWVIRNKQGLVSSPLIEVHNLGFRIEDRWLFRHLSFALGPDEFLAVTGDSGIGKSTFLKCLSGELQATEGQIKWHCIRNEVPQDLLIPDGMTGSEVIRSGACLRLRDFSTFFSTEASNIKLRVLAIAQALGIEAVLEKDIEKTSGGEKQRLAIARALINCPVLLLLDEPVSQLDSTNAKLALRCIQAAQKKINGSTICVLHQNDLIQEFSTRSILFSEGGYSWSQNA